MPYEAMVGRVVGQLNGLAAISSLHLTSVAKAIEHSADERIKIIFRPMAAETLGKWAPAVLLTQRLEVTGPGIERPFLAYEHFIYHLREDERSVATRFHVAHELGHILLHKPYTDDSEDARYYIPLEGTATDMYGVEYRPEEEMEADLFAAILHHQRPGPVRPRMFHELCLRAAEQLAGLGVFRSNLPDLVQRVRDCRVFR